MAAMRFTDWNKLDHQQKLDALREEVMGIKRLIQYGVGFAGLIGTAFGSFCTVAVQHFLHW